MTFAAVGRWLYNKFRGETPPHRGPSGAAATTTTRRKSRRAAMREERGLPVEFGYRTAPPKTIATIEAAYDALSNGSLLRNAWVNADHLNADEANSAAVRLEARRRSRYECLEANSFLKGAIHTVAADMIGRGPRLQMQLTGNLAKFNKPIERAWRKWCKKTRLAKTLRTMAIAKIVDGESFAMFTTSRKAKGIATLYLRTFEADRCTSLVVAIDGPHQVDGLKIDTDTGEVTHFYVHDTISPHMLGQPTEIPADQVCHWFKQDRPGQHRGIPELITSLPLCVLLREYTLAVVSAARTAAKHTAILQTNSSDVSNDDDDELIPFSTADIEYDQLTVMPKGYSLNQMRAEQPTSTYEMTRDCMLGEIVRPLQAPLNIVLGSSAKWNYASTQADHVTYDLKLLIEREECETEVVEPTFAEWWREMQLLGQAPAEVDAEDAEHAFFWDRRRDADPQTMASARETNLKTGATNRSDELALRGVDIDSHDEQAATASGLTVPQYRLILAKHLWGADIVDSALATKDTSSPGMNGAQIQGLVLILQQVGAGAIAPAAARAAAAAAFPSLTHEQIAGIFPDPPAVDPSAAGTATPEAAAGSITPAAAQPSGVYTEIGQRAFNNNLKRIQSILKQVAEGSMSRVLAETTLGSIGLGAEQITLLLDDAADGSVDSPEVASA